MIAGSMVHTPAIVINCAYLIDRAKQWPSTVVHNILHTMLSLYQPDFVDGFLCCGVGYAKDFLSD